MIEFASPMSTEPIAPVTPAATIDIAQTPEERAADPMPNPKIDHPAFVEWCGRPAGVAFMARLNSHLMEKRAAGMEGGAVEINIHFTDSTPEVAT